MNNIAVLSDGSAGRHQKRKRDPAKRQGRKRPNKLEATVSLERRRADPSESLAMNNIVGLSDGSAGRQQKRKRDLANPSDN